MKSPAWPGSLAARTALVLLAGLAVVQAVGLVIHALDHADLQRNVQMHDVAQQAMGTYRSLAVLSPADRLPAITELPRTASHSAAIEPQPPEDALPPASVALQRELAGEMLMVPVPTSLRPRDTVVLGRPGADLLVIGLRFPDGPWLHQRFELPPLRPWNSPSFLISFLLMTAAAAIMTVWAVRRLTLPVAVLAAAADRLGRDVNAPALPETGPSEVVTAAAAFNTMALRIRRFVHDRTLMLTAIGHDLRTPITRMRLRSEFIDDEALRARMLNDLDELEAMVSATLAFGRDAAAAEAASRIDVAELLRTILDETADARPACAERLSMAGPEHFAVTARPLSLKRALTNLIANAVTYGQAAHVRLGAPPQGAEGVDVSITIDDDGPGIAADQMERMFQPFQRMEESRSRDTGGVGLGLPIARNILRAHGGDVVLENRASGGLRARVTLPV
ncbi:MAG: ATP-binding protein [Alphaproteobacteria bacterium]|nr:ATP-binding protein [Alphaproteobacteria bacterium]